MQKHFIGLFIVFSCLTIHAQVETRSYLTDDKLVPREHNVDMQHMKLELSFKPTEGLVIGKATHSFITLQKAVDSLFLDGPGITIKSAKLNGESIEFKTNPKGVTLQFKPLQWGSKNNVEVAYEAKPKKGLYFIGWNDPKNMSRKQIWSQGQGIDNRNWIPFYDEMNDKLTTEMVVTFDSKYKVLSNGTKLKEKVNKDGTTTWHYKMTHPHAPYLVMLGIGEYGIKESKSKSGVPMYFWYYPENEDRVPYMYKYSEDMMDYFEETIGVKYPWESYAQIPVQDFMYGAMENTTATIFGDFYNIDARGYLDRNYVNTNAHELAHQWFGDLVTARASAHHWLQESFATYYNMLYERRVFGQEHYDWERREATESALKASKQNVKPIAHSSAGVVRHYPKGAHVLHMLKYVVGEEQYNAAIKYYLNKHAYANVDSEDLLVAFHERLGVSLDWFWEQWVYRGGEPEYKVNFEEIEKDGNRYSSFDVYQTHTVNDVVTLFKMPIIFEVHYQDGSKDSKKVWIENEHHRVLVENSNKKEVAYVLFDPNSEVMKNLVFNKSNDMLKNQATKAEWMIDRYDAIVALRGMDVADKRDMLVEQFEKENHYPIKNEILSQIMDDSHPKSIELIRMATNDNQARVRLASLDAVGIAPEPLLEDFEKLLTDSSYNVVEKALDRLSYHNPAGIEKYLELTKGVNGNVGNHIKVKWLEVAYSNKKDSKLADELVDMVSQSYEFRTRVNAVKALGRLNYMNDSLLVNIFDALMSPNSRLAKPCGEVLSEFYNDREFKQYIINYLEEHPLDEKLAKRLENYIG